MDVQIVLAHIDACDYFCHVFRSFPHGLFGFVPSIHSDPGRRLGHRVRFAKGRIDYIRGFTQRNPGVPIAIGFVPDSDGRIRHDPNPKNQSKRSRLQGQVIHRKCPEKLSTPPNFCSWFVDHMRIYGHTYYPPTAPHIKEQEHGKQFYISG